MPVTVQARTSVAAGAGFDAVAVPAGVGGWDAH